MIEPDPIPEEFWTDDYRAFRARWYGAERWWPWFKRLHHVGTWLLKLSIFGCLLDLLFCGPDDWTAFTWLIVPGGALGGLVCLASHVVGELVIRAQRRALDAWEPQNAQHIACLRAECIEIGQGKRRPPPLPEGRDTPVPGATGVFDTTLVDVDEGKR